MQVLLNAFMKLLYKPATLISIIIPFLLAAPVSESFSQDDSTGYYPDGSTRFKGKLVDSLREGLWLFYYPGGTVSARVPYHKDLLHGKACYFDNHSNLIALENWSNGLQEDSSWYYYPNGILEKKGRFALSLHEGTWTFFYNNGILRQKGTYINGLPEGLWEFYNEKGIKVQQGEFKNGLEDGKWVFFDNNGHKTYLGSFFSGKRSGIWYKVKKNGRTRIYREYPEKY